MIYALILLMLILLAVKYDFRPVLKTNGKVSGRSIWLFFLWLILVLLAGLRHETIGGDTLNYAASFNRVHDIANLADSDFSDSRFQPGWIYFIAICKYISSDFFICQLIHAIIINLLFFKFIKRHSEHVFLALLFYFILNYFEFNTEVLRESLAVSLCVSGYYALEKRKYWICILLLCGAYYIHISAIIAILYALLFKVRYTKKSLAISAAMIITVSIIFTSIKDLSVYVALITNSDTEYFNQYYNQELNSHLNLNYYIIHFLKYVIIPYAAIYIISKHKQIPYVGYIYAFIILQVMGMYSYAFYRFANYFTPFFWLLLADFIYIIINRYIRSSGRVLAIAATVIMFLYIYQSVQLLYDSDTNKYFYERYIPYKSALGNVG